LPLIVITLSAELQSSFTCKRIWNGKLWNINSFHDLRRGTASIRHVVPEMELVEERKDGRMEK